VMRMRLYLICWERWINVQTQRLNCSVREPSQPFVTGWVILKWKQSNYCPNISIHFIRCNCISSPSHITINCQIRDWPIQRSYRVFQVLQPEAVESNSWQENPEYSLLQHKTVKTGCSMKPEQFLTYKFLSPVLKTQTTSHYQVVIEQMSLNMAEACCTFQQERRWVLVFQ